MLSGRNDWESKVSSGIQTRSREQISFLTAFILKLPIAVWWQKQPQAVPRLCGLYSRERLFLLALAAVPGLSGWLPLSQPGRKVCFNQVLWVEQERVVLPGRKAG